MQHSPSSTIRRPAFATLRRPSGSGGGIDGGGPLSSGPSSPVPYGMEQDLSYAGFLVKRPRTSATANNGGIASGGAGPATGIRSSIQSLTNANSRYFRLAPLTTLRERAVVWWLSYHGSEAPTSRERWGTSVEEIVRVARVPDPRQQVFTIVTRDRVLELVAPSQAILDAWIRHIELARAATRKSMFLAQLSHQHPQSTSPVVSPPGSTPATRQGTLARLPQSPMAPVRGRPSHSYSTNNLLATITTGPGNRSTIAASAADAVATPRASEFNSNRPYTFAGAAASEVESETLGLPRRASIRRSFSAAAGVNSIGSAPTLPTSSADAVHAPPKPTLHSAAVSTSTFSVYPTSTPDLLVAQRAGEQVLAAFADGKPEGSGAGDDSTWSGITTQLQETLADLERIVNSETPNSPITPTSPPPIVRAFTVSPDSPEHPPLDPEYRRSSSTSQAPTVTAADPVTPAPTTAPVPVAAAPLNPATRTIVQGALHPEFVSLMQQRAAVAPAPPPRPTPAQIQSQAQSQPTVQEQRRGSNETERTLYRDRSADRYAARLDEADGDADPPRSPTATIMPNTPATITPGMFRGTSNNDEEGEVTPAVAVPRVPPARGRSTVSPSSSSSSRKAAAVAVLEGLDWDPMAALGMIHQHQASPSSATGSGHGSGSRPANGAAQ
ncbi:hypothetical protein H9P43_005738 [Blastocladiella emersonii ATCC 22665]|nr:hypothetical protein H9P43_005738 [Blastocladiella emersonii ATCC 22665]